jgi:hypothetical protein
MRELQGHHAEMVGEFGVQFEGEGAEEGIEHSVPIANAMPE